MSNDAYRDMSHQEMQNALMGRMIGISETVRREYILPNRKIADVYVQIFGVTVIFEVKTTWKLSYIDNSLDKYKSECDFLIMVTPPLLAYYHADNDALSWAEEDREAVGIWHLDWEGMTVQRQPMRLDRKITRLSVSRGG